MNKLNRDIKQDIMSRITAGEISPRRRGWFTCLECFVWTFWLVTVLFGAVAVAIIAYTTVNGWYGFYEGAGMTRLGMVLTYIPVMWLVVLVLTVGLAIRNVRQTKRGYRYPVWVILSSSIGLSVAGGILLYVIGFGFSVDMELGKRMSTYPSHYKAQEQFWQTPQENRWLGTVTSDSPTTFVDMNNQRWALDMTDLSAEEQTLLMAGAQVRLIGMAEASSTIRVCSVLAWQEDKPQPIMERAKDRETLIEQLRNLKKSTSTCASMPMLERMP